MIPRVAGPPAKALARRHPIVTITGPRQSGKTTLATATWPDKPHVSLERPDLRRAAQDDPRGFLADLAKGAILDEVQRVPELASYLQVLVDEDPAPGRFILTGSENFLLAETVSQSLAGRAALVQLLPFELFELRQARRPPAELWPTLFTGGYPRIHDKGLPPTEWLADYVRNYVERDVRQVLRVADLSAFDEFLRLCAGRVGQLLNLSSLGSDCGITHNTARSWLSVLETSYVVFRLRPWHANVSKRLIKTPKLYFYDTGLLCYLLDIREPAQLTTHPLRGAVFECWVVSEILKARLHRRASEVMHFYREQKGGEVDLVLQSAAGLRAIEAKSARTADAQVVQALEAFRKTARPHGKFDTFLVYGGDERRRWRETVVLPWSALDRVDWTVV